MDQGRVLGGRLQRIDGGGQRLIVHIDVIERVFRLVAVIGDHQGHRLADETHPVDSQRPLIERQAQNDEKRLGLLLDLGPGQHRGDAGPLQGARDIDRDDFRMGMGRAQNGTVQGARRHRQIIGKRRRPGEQDRVFHPLQGLAEIFFFMGGLAHSLLFRCFFVIRI